MIKPRIRKRDGRRVYMVRLRDTGGREYSRTFLTRKEAERFEASERVAHARGGWVDPRRSSATLKAVAEAWLAANPTKRESSRERDRVILEAHVIPVLGDRAIGSITRADVQTLVNSWAATHAASTTAREYSCLRAVMSYAEAADMIGRSPCRHIRLPQVSLVERPVLTADRLSSLADALDEDQAVMMWLGVVLGLRWAEASGISVRSIDFLAGTLTVSQQLGRDRTVHAPKSAAGRRTLAVPRWLLEELTVLLARRGLTAADGDQLVFVTMTGAALHYNNWRTRIWQPACREAGLEGLRFHDLRSMAATALVAEGVDPKTAQARLGHSSSRLTLDLYARVTAQADQEAAEKVGERFRPRTKRGPIRSRTPPPSARHGP